MLLPENKQSNWGVGSGNLSPDIIRGLAGAVASRIFVQPKKGGGSVGIDEISFEMNFRLHSRGGVVMSRCGEGKLGCRSHRGGKHSTDTGRYCTSTNTQAPFLTCPLEV